MAWFSSWKFERQFTEIGEERKGLRHLPWINSEKFNSSKKKNNEKFKERELTIHNERRKNNVELSHFINSFVQPIIDNPNPCFVYAKSN